MPSEILPHILELMRPLKGVTARAMFGGHGIYRNGLIFAIVADGELFFKVTDANRADYEERGLQPFTYEAKNKKRVAMSYYQAPPECLDDSRFMVEWAEKSLKNRR